MGRASRRLLGRGAISAALALAALALTPLDGVAGSFSWKGTETCTSVDECKYAMAHLVSSASFAAGPFETNRLSVAMDTSAIAVRDEANAVSVGGAGCRSVDRRSATCPMADTLDVLLGDRDDTARISSTAAAPPPSAPSLTVVSVDGGPGSDQLSLLSDIVFPHVLIGGPGSDTLSGGPGQDTLADAGTGEPDAYDGRAGADTVSYKKRRAGMKASLGAASGNEDRLAGIESLVGGSGTDLLRGDGLPNTLQGGPGKDSLFGVDGPDQLDGLTGDDRLDGGAGADLIRGGPGADDLRGGPGADTLDPGNEGKADRVRCGPGMDRVISGDQDFIDVGREFSGVPRRDDRGERLPLPLGPQPTGYESPSSDSGTVDEGEGMDFRDLIAGDCESVELSVHRVLGSPRRAGRRVLVRVITTGDDDDMGDCLGTQRLVLTLGRKVLGSAKLPPNSAKRARLIKIKLNRRGRRLVRRGRTTTVSDSSRNCDGFAYRTRVR